MVGIASRDEGLVGGGSEHRTGRRLGIVDIDHQRIRAGLPQRRPHRSGVFSVGQDDFGLAMLEDEPDRTSIQPRIDATQYGTEHRNGVMSFEHFGRVRRHDGNGIALPYPGFRQRRRQPPAPLGELRIGIAAVAMDDGDSIGVNARRTPQKGHRR